MQTIKVPYTTDAAGAQLIAEIRRIQSSAIRSAYALALSPAGTKRSEKDIRTMVKARFAGLGILGSWALHCAARLGMAKRKARPDGKMVFGGKANLARRRKGLISNAEWKHKRLLPFTSFGDRQKAYGNQNVRLVDASTVVVKIGRRTGSGRSGPTVTETATLRLSNSFSSERQSNGGLPGRHRQAVPPGCAERARRAAFGAPKGFGEVIGIGKSAGRGYCANRCVGGEQHTYGAVDPPGENVIGRRQAYRSGKQSYEMGPAELGGASKHFDIDRPRQVAVDELLCAHHRRRQLRPRLWGAERLIIKRHDGGVGCG
jgi:hypothetical protein